MQPHNPYAPPVAKVDDIEEDHSDESIEALPVSEKWKDRFKAIAHAGGVKFPNLKDLPKNERRKAFSFNVLAFLFGPVYYIAKGMWKKGLALFIGVRAGRDCAEYCAWLFRVGQDRERSWLRGERRVRNACEYRLLQENGFG